MQKTATFFSWEREASFQGVWRIAGSYCLLMHVDAFREGAKHLDSRKSRLGKVSRSRRGEAWFDREIQKLCEDRGFQGLELWGENPRQWTLLVGAGDEMSFARGGVHQIDGDSKAGAALLLAERNREGRDCGEAQAPTFLMHLVGELFPIWTDMSPNIMTFRSTTFKGFVNYEGQEICAEPWLCSVEFHGTNSRGLNELPR
eukprot:s2862_g13.t1